MLAHDRCSASAAVEIGKSLFTLLPVGACTATAHGN